MFVLTAHRRCVLPPVLALGLIAILVSLAPCAAALEIHHALAAADQDGHEHSDSDLCQWVQHHTAQSVLSVCPSPLATLHVGVVACIALDALVSGRPLPSGPLRGPPVL